MARRAKAKRTANRTASGGVSAAARRKYGGVKGRFPVFDAKSAKSALILRGRAKTKSERSSVIRRAAKYAPAAAKAARANDKKAGRV